MKEKIYTTPLLEALEEDGECLFCTLQQKTEEDVLDFVMGSSYMEEDVRAETDRMGFCAEHYRQMYRAGNRLGLALILETHWRKKSEEVIGLLEKELQEKGKRRAFSGKKEEPSAGEILLQKNETCYACARVEKRMEQLTDTFFYLWKREADFRTKVRESHGFCFYHLGVLLQAGKKKLSAEGYGQFLEVLLPLQTESGKRLGEDLEWFIRKYDYRYQQEPWKGAEDAVERGILKAAGAWLRDK